MKKRGISTIIGGIIFLILLTAGFSAFFVAMEVQSDTIEAQRSISDSIIGKTQEQFSMAALADDDNAYKLAIQVMNDGPNPLEISDIWIINKSEADHPIVKIPVNYSDAFIPAGANASILENQHLTMLPPAGPGPDLYDIKVVSVLGSIQKSELRVGGNNFLLAEMFTIPPDVRHNENVTIAMRITNVGPTLITGIAPDLDFNPNGVESTKVTWLSVPELISATPVDLKPSESTIFSWQATLTTIGTFGTKVKFTNSASGTESATGISVSSNTASDKLTVRDPEGGGGEDIVIKDELFAKPGIFMIIPNTFGDDDAPMPDGEEGLWGVTVANPADAPMDVRKITISVLFAGANDNHKIFESQGNPGNCVKHTNVAPLPNNYWRCPNQNQLVWYDDTSPYYLHTIPPRSAYTFLVTVNPGSITGGAQELDSVVLHTSVFTTLGAFGETKWTSSMAGEEEALVNTYLYEQDPAISPYADVNFMNGSRVNIPAGSTQTFQIGLADLNTSHEEIEAGAELIINIPKEFTNIVLNSWTGGNGDFVDTPTVTPFDDGSHQIVGILETDLVNNGRLISFDATAPSPSCDKMYIMYVLANGVTDKDRPIGPISEIVLEVNPAGPCS